jgi:hypothetical protein
MEEHRHRDKVFSKPMGILRIFGIIYNTIHSQIYLYRARTAQDDSGRKRHKLIKLVS